LDEEIDKSKRRIKLIVAKNRNGPTGRLPLIFEGAHTRFVETDWRHK